MRASLLTRRLLAPAMTVLVLGWGSVAVAIAASGARSMGMAVGVAGVATCAFFLIQARRYGRQQAQETEDATEAAVAAEKARSGGESARLRAILSSMNEGVIAVDHAHQVLLANEAAERLLGTTLATARGRPLWEQVDVPGVAQVAAEVMLTGQTRSFAAGPREGRYMEVTVSRLAAAEGLIIVAHDVTEATRYQRLREEFVANVSHELRTPLTIIKGFIETLLDGAMEDRERARQYLATAGSHAEQLAALVDDLLDLSRVESGVGIDRTDRVDVAEVVNAAGERMRPVAQRKGQLLEVMVEGALPEVMGSEKYLVHALSNLLDNASKYTGEGGTIRLSARAEGGGVRIAVQDNGAGIPAEDLPRIFERFYRSDRSRSRAGGGTGLGLAIVKHIAQAHGGSVEVASRLGEGSTFTLRLPGAG